MRLRDLEFSYRNDLKPVIKINSFDICQGEHLFMHGPSGSGKTTLLSLMAGLLVPQRGSIEILGTKLTSLKSHERDFFRGSHIGYIFQMFNLIPYLNVRDNIQLPVQMNPLRAKRLHLNLKESILELASSLQIENLLEKPVTDLSVGQQQRVAAARALIGSPELVIADEPTSALDFDRRQAFLDTLFRAADRNGSTILFVSHDHSLVPLFTRSVPLKDLNQVS
jgi:putative ABC transport system ATP-binding protein